MKAVRTALNRWQDGDGNGDSMTSDIPQFDNFEPSYKLIPNVFGEQAPEEVPTEEPAPPPEETTQAEPQADPAAIQDPTAMGGDMGVDPSMGDPAAIGMEPEGPTSPIEVGRLYELKKIHSRLVSVQSFLADSTDPQLSELKQYVNQSIELFRTLISNIQLFKDQLDDIIVMYYNFLDTIFAMLSKYYKTNTDGPSKYVRTWGK